MSSEIRKAYGIFSPDERRPITAIVAGEGARDSLHICWALHGLCNFHCSYCDEANWGGRHQALKFDDAVLFMMRVFVQYPNRRFHVSFTGGEPTLWPDFLRFCEFLNKRGCDLGLTSNGSRPVSYWLKIADWLNWACLSYHPEHTRDEEFLRVIETVAPRCRLAIRLMMHPDRDRWDAALEMGRKIKGRSANLPLFVEYVPLQKDFAGDKEPWPYEPWQLDFFRDNNNFTLDTASREIQDGLRAKRDVWDYFVLYEDGSRALCRPNELVAADRVNFNGWTCQAGREQLFVRVDGKVFKAGCLVDGPVGKINGDIDWPQGPVICDRNFCPCGTDILMSKTSKVGPG